MEHWNFRSHIFTFTYTVTLGKIHPQTFLLDFFTKLFFSFKMNFCSRKVFCFLILLFDAVLRHHWRFENFQMTWGSRKFSFPLSSIFHNLMAFFLHSRNISLTLSTLLTSNKSFVPELAFSELRNCIFVHSMTPFFHLWKFNFSFSDTFSASFRATQW